MTSLTKLLCFWTAANAGICIHSCADAIQGNKAGGAVFQLVCAGIQLFYWLYFIGKLQDAPR